MCKYETKAGKCGLKGTYAYGRKCYTPDACKCVAPITNADKIRCMSDEELARNNVRKRRGYVIWSTSDGREFISYLFGGTYRPDEETIALAIQHELDWLQQPAKEEHHEDD